MNTVTHLSPPLVHGPEDCPVETTLRVIGGRWKAVIIYHLRGGPRRFNELRRMLPNITQRMLTQHLRELQADGILDRRVFEVVPPHVEYSISDAGKTLLPILDALAAWGQDRQAERAAA
jgi:DNA-binding HxlR family transcriptional regulator